MKINVQVTILLLILLAFTYVLLSANQENYCFMSSENNTYYIPYTIQTVNVFASNSVIPAVAIYIKPEVFTKSTFYWFGEGYSKVAIITDSYATVIENDNTFSFKLNNPVYITEKSASIIVGEATYTFSVANDNNSPKSQANYVLVIASMVIFFFIWWVIMKNS